MKKTSTYWHEGRGKEQDATSSIRHPSTIHPPSTNTSSVCLFVLTSSIHRSSQYCLSIHQSTHPLIHSSTHSSIQLCALFFSSRGFLWREEGQSVLHGPASLALSASIIPLLKAGWLAGRLLFCRLRRRGSHFFLKRLHIIPCAS